MIRSFIYWMFMGKKRGLQRAPVLAEKPIEYSSQKTKMDLADADLRRIEVTSIIEEIFRLGRKRRQKASSKMEDIKNAA